MAAMESQVYLQTYYAQRGEQRGNHARRASGNNDVRYAEAFQRVLPQVVPSL
jgi:4-oxalomesaconate hydratase